MVEDGPGLALYDEKGQGRAELRMVSGLVLYDEKGNPRAALTAGKEGPQLSLFDEKGKPLWQAP